LAVTLGGRRVEGDLPGAQGRLLLSYLVLHRARDVPRDELTEAIWPGGAPAAAPAALRALLSKLRGALGAGAVTGQHAVGVRLPDGTWVDVEAAQQAIHEAESAVAQEQWRRAWIAAHIARNVATRPLLAGHEAPWLDDERTKLADVAARALAALAAAGLGIGGPELQLAVRAARTLIEREPYRESGYALLMRALDAQGDRAEAVLVFDALRRKLSEDLGMAPSAPLQSLHAELVRG
jgi:DNA-binding SARP family transcriptional activator